MPIPDVSDQETAWDGRQHAASSTKQCASSLIEEQMASLGVLGRSDVGELDQETLERRANVDAWCILFRQALSALCSLGGLEGFPLQSTSQSSLATLITDLWRILEALQRQVALSRETDAPELEGFQHLLGLGWRMIAGFTTVPIELSMPADVATWLPPPSTS